VEIDFPRTSSHLGSARCNLRPCERRDGPCTLPPAWLCDTNTCSSMNSIPASGRRPPPGRNRCRTSSPRIDPGNKLPNSTSSLPVASRARRWHGPRPPIIVDCNQCTTNFDIKFKMTRCAEPPPLRKYRTISIVSPAPPGISHFFEGNRERLCHFGIVVMTGRHPPSPARGGQSEAQSAIMSVAPHFFSQSRKRPAAEPSCIARVSFSTDHTHRSCQ